LDVPQGTVLAPLSFIIYINEIPDSITNMLKLYADNALLYSTINLTVDCINLETDLLTLQKWTETWQMKFNLARCEHFQFTNKHNFIDTYNAQKVTNTKYLV